MNLMMKTPFTVTRTEIFFHPLEALKSMRMLAGKIANDLGLDKGDTDSFRHAYVSAKVADLMPFSREAQNLLAGDLGLINEVYGQGSLEDHLVDLRNNQTGLLLRDEVDQHMAQLQKQNPMTAGEAENLREELLRTIILQDIRDGELNQKFDRKDMAKVLENIAPGGSDVFVHGYIRNDPNHDGPEWVSDYTRGAPVHPDYR